MLPQTWLPLIAPLVAVIRSLTVGRGFSSMILAISWRSPATQAVHGRSSAGASSLASSRLLASRSEPHPVGVAVAVRPRVRVAGGGRRTSLAEDDHPGGAAVDAQRAACADVVV